VRFPSARPSGNAANDLAAMEWFTARAKGKSILKARAIVVVHESGNNMIVGRLIARGLSAQGLHAFLLHLPGYGERRTAEATDIKQMLPAMQQAIADVRRARDAVVALPNVDPTIVGVQGTSLGGFVTATAAGLDRGYDRVFILLAGGNLHEVVLHGAKDAAKVRARLFAAGVTEDQIIDMARQVEPLRLAHRLNPAGTWVYNGSKDDVVLPSSSRALVKAAGLAADHHIELPADHYSGIIHLPTVLQQMYRQMVEPLDENQSAEKALNRSP
jgi:dienelactone hydrolase